MRWPSLKLAVGYVVGVALLTYAVAAHWQPAGGRVGLGELVGRPVDGPLLALAAGTMGVGLLLAAVRWCLLTRAAGVAVTAGEGLRLWAVGYFYNVFVPGGFGGDIVRTLAVARGRGEVARVVGSAVFDRAVGLVGLVAFVAVYGLALVGSRHPAVERSPTLVTLVLAAVAALAAATLGWAAISVSADLALRRLGERLERLPGVGRPAAELLGVASLYGRQPGAVLLAVGLAVANRACSVLTFDLIARAVVPPGQAELVPTLVEHGLIVPMGGFVQAVVPTPGGVGAGELGFGYLYARLGRPESLGILASLGLRGLSFATAAVAYFAALAGGWTSERAGE